MDFKDEHLFIIIYLLQIKQQFKKKNYNNKATFWIVYRNDKLLLFLQF